MPADNAEPVATSNHKSTQEHAAGLSPKLRTVALIVAAMAFIMDLLDTTIVNVAIPSIQNGLQAGYSAVQWIVAGYSLVFALLLITGGRMGDVFGYKKLFLIGVGSFTLASLLCGVAPNAASLIAARILQGGAAALMVPQVLSLLQVMYKPEERAAVNGLFGALAGVAASLGPVIGGALLEWNIAGLEWRPIFLINVPVGLASLLLGLRFLPGGKSPHPLKLDIRGTWLIVLALFLLVFPLIQGRDLGWPWWTFVMMAAAVPFFAWFVRWQRRKERTDGSPLVLPSLFKIRSFSVGVTLNLVFQACIASFFLTNALFLQIGLGFTPLHAAVTGLPIAVFIALTMATLSRSFLPRLGRYSFSIGSAILAAGLITNGAVLFHYQLATHSWQLIPGLALIGLGMGFVFGSLFTAVLNGVDSRHAGSASGTLNAIQQVGAAIGVASIGLVFFGQLSSAAGTSFDVTAPKLQASLNAAKVPPAAQNQIKQATRTCFVDRAKEKDSTIIPPSCRQTTQGNASPASRAIASAAANGARTANAANFANAFRASTIYQLCLLAVTYGLSFLLPKHFKAPPAEAAGI